MTVETGDILKVVLDYLYPGAGTALNIFYYKLFDAPQTDSDVLDAIEDWARDDWGDHWDALAVANSNLNNAVVQIVDGTGTVLRDVGSRVINLDGALGGDVSPAAVSVYLLARTASPQIRGNKYVPAIAEAVISNGVLDAGATANTALLLLEYLSNIVITVGNQIVPGVISTKEGDFKSFQDDGSFSLIPAYQRRRKQGVGT